MKNVSPKLEFSGGVFVEGQASPLQRQQERFLSVYQFLSSLSLCWCWSTALSDDPLREVQWANSLLEKADWLSAIVGYAYLPSPDIDQLLHSYSKCSKVPSLSLSLSICLFCRLLTDWLRIGQRCETDSQPLPHWSKPDMAQSLFCWLPEEWSGLCLWLFSFAEIWLFLWFAGDSKRALSSSSNQPTTQVKSCGDVVAMCWKEDTSSLWLHRLIHTNWLMQLHLCTTTKKFLSF